MYRRLFSFELRLQLASPVFWLTTLLFLGMGFVLAVSDPVPINPAINGLHHNAAAIVVFMLAAISLFGIFVAAVFVSTALLRDDAARMTDLIHVTRIRRSGYAGTRMAAAFVLVVAVLLAAAAGMSIGACMPWLSPQDVGPMPWAAYAMAIGVMMVPNALFASAFVAAAIATTRSMKRSVVAVIALFVLHSVANAMFGSHPLLAALIDPFGGQALDQAVASWTATDVNARVPITSLVWLNRGLWLIVSAGLAAFALARFKVARPDPLRAGKVTDGRSAPDTTGPIAKVAMARGLRAEWRKAMSLARNELLNTALGVPFLASLFAVTALVVVSLILERSATGVPVYPLTHFVFRVISQVIAVPAMVILGFFAGELVHREREDRLAALIDTCPLSRTAWLLGKSAALVGLMVLLVVTCLLAGLSFQLVSGFTDVEPLLYVAGAGVLALPILIFSAGALAIQVASANKYAGYLLTAALGGSSLLLPALGVQDHLLLFATASPIPYSDMNGFGTFLAAAGWFYLYWGCAVLALLLVASTFRVRGDAVDARARWAVAKLQLRRPVLAASIALLLGASVATGLWIFHNTHQLNALHPNKTAMAGQARYEKLYQHYATTPQPRIVRVNLAVDLHPHARLVDVHGTYDLLNKSRQAITALFVTTDSRTDTSLTLPAATAVLRDTVAGFSIYRLGHPLLPGQAMRLVFSTRYQHRGFTNDASDNDLVANGTFINNSLLPSIGYDRNREIQAHGDRKELGLGVRPAIVDVNNPYLSQDADGIAFHAIVSTEADQTPLAPGNLVRTWTAAGRAYAEFASERPMANLYGFLSAHWVLTQTHWQGVTLQVYADPKHPWNVDRMMTALKDGLSAYSSEYGPYPLSEIRVAEFPDYRDFAQSFAGTIAFSEDLGFTSQGAVDGGIDFPYLITAHELAHQWWGHQLVPADAPGALLLTESMAQYSAIQLVDLHEHSTLAALLAYERGQYRIGLSSVDGHDEPLDKVTDQAFVAYDKGALAMLAYQAMLGPARTARVLREYFHAHAGLAAPYPLASNFVATLRAAIPPPARPRFDQWFTAGGMPASVPPRHPIADDHGGDNGDPLGRFR